MLPEGHDGIETTNASWLAKLEAVAAERATIAPLPRAAPRPRASLPPPRRCATGTFTALKAAPPAIPAPPAIVAAPIDLTAPLSVDELEPVDMTAPLSPDELERVDLTAPLSADELEPIDADASMPVMFEATPTPLPPPVALDDSLPIAPLALDQSSPIGLTTRFDRSATYIAPIAPRAIPVRVIAAAVVAIAVIAVAFVAIRGSSSSPAPAAIATVERAPSAAPALPPPQPVIAPQPVVAPPPPAPVIAAPAIVKPRPQAHGSVWAKAAAQPSAKRVATATANTGTLMISTKPPCAIIIDGKPTRWMTPQRALVLPVGNHTLTFIDAAKKPRGKLAIHVEPQRTTKIIRDFMH